MSIFNKIYNAPQINSSLYESGAYLGRLDILMSRARRLEFVNESKILDYIQVEGDPNYRRDKNRFKLENILGKVATAQSLFTTISGNLSMIGVYNFIPANVQQMFVDGFSLLNTNLAILDSVQNGLLFSQIEQVFFKDLEVQIAGINISFSDVVNMLYVLEENMPLLESIKNSGLRSILSLPLFNILPNGLRNIVNAGQYADHALQAFKSIEQRENAKSSFLEYEKQSLQTVLNIDTLVSPSDPLGINKKNKVVQDIKLDFYKYVSTYTDYQPLIDYVTKEYNIIIDKHLLDTDILLPSLSESVKSIKVYSYNESVQAMSRAFYKVADRMIVDLGVINKKTDSIDYLVNIKKSLILREQIKVNQNITQEYRDSELFLKSVIVGNDISEKNIEDLKNRVESIFNEKMLANNG